MMIEMIADCKWDGGAGLAAVGEEPPGVFQIYGSPHVDLTRCIAPGHLARAGGRIGDIDYDSPEDALAIALESMDGLPGTGEPPTVVTIDIRVSGTRDVIRTRKIKAGGGLTAEDVALSLKAAGLFDAASNIREALAEIEWLLEEVTRRLSPVLSSATRDWPGMSPDDLAQVRDALHDAFGEITAAKVNIKDTRLKAASQSKLPDSLSDPQLDGEGSGHGPPPDDIEDAG